MITFLIRKRSRASGIKLIICDLGGDYWMLFSLISRAHALRQGSLSISEYALAHQTLWDEVDHYLPTDDPTCRSYQNTLLTRLLGFLRGPNREYDDIRRRALRCKDELPKLANLVKELQEEESHFLLHGCPPMETTRDSSALLTPTTSSGILGQTPSASNGSSSVDIICSHCRRVGHTRDRCFKLHPELVRKKKPLSKALLTQTDSFVSVPSSSASSSKADGSVMTMEQLQADFARLSAQLSAMTAMQTASSTSFFGAFSSSSSDIWYCGQTALSSPLVSDTTWVLDSRATEHMTPFNSRFVSYQRHLGGRTVFTAAGTRLPVAGIGAVHVAGLGVVHHVLHVPSLRAILLSPHRLVDFVLCSFHLKPDGMFLFDKVGRTTPIRRANGLLLLDDGGRSQCFTVQHSIRSVDEQQRGRLQLTHQGLGHPPFSTL